MRQFDEPWIFGKNNNEKHWLFKTKDKIRLGTVDQEPSFESGFGYFKTFFSKKKIINEGKDRTEAFYWTKSEESWSIYCLNQWPMVTNGIRWENWVKIWTNVNYIYYAVYSMYIVCDN